MNNTLNINAMNPIHKLLVINSQDADDSNA